MRIILPQGGDIMDKKNKNREQAQNKKQEQQQNRQPGNNAENRSEKQ